MAEFIILALIQFCIVNRFIHSYERASVKLWSHDGVRVMENANQTRMLRLATLLLRSCVPLSSRTRDCHPLVIRAALLRLKVTVIVFSQGAHCCTTEWWTALSVVGLTPSICKCCLMILFQVTVGRHHAHIPTASAIKIPSVWSSSSWPYAVKP